MQLIITTDYAIRLVYYLSMEKEMKNTTVIANALGIPASYVQKVVKPLKEAGILEAVEGLQGGYRLAKKSDQITLFDIISATEKTMKINRCLETDAYCSRFAVPTCPVRKVYTVLQRQFEDRLSEITISELLQEKVSKRNVDITNIVLNIATDHYVLEYSHNSTFENHFAADGCFSETAEKFIAQYIHPDDQQPMKDFLSFDNMIQDFANGLEERKIRYRQKSPYGYMWMEFMAYHNQNYKLEKVLLVANNIPTVQRELDSLDVSLTRKTKELEKTYWGVMDFIGTILEYYSADLKQHIQAVEHYTKQILLKMQQLYPEIGLNDEQVNVISHLALLHDIGKISISEAILKKKTSLTKEEINQMKQHTTVGANIVKCIPRLREHEKWAEIAQDICMYHHERYDGSGYPSGIKGEKIPISAQVVGIADAYAALTSDRIYKEAYSHEKAKQMIQHGECGAFSDRIYDCFTHALQEPEWQFIEKHPESERGCGI